MMNDECLRFESLKVFLATYYLLLTTNTPITFQKTGESPALFP